MYLSGLDSAALGPSLVEVSPDTWGVPRSGVSGCGFSQAYVSTERYEKIKV